EPVADHGEGAGVGRGVGARGAADRRLVDVDDLVELLQAGDLAARAARDPGAVQSAGSAGVERVDGQARLAAAADPGDAGEGAERELDRDAIEVVGGRAMNRGELARALAAGGVERDLAPAGEVIGGQAVGAGEEVVEGSGA